MDFKYGMRGDYLVIDISVRRATSDLAPLIKERMISEIRNGNDQIILNLSYVEFVDSSFLGALVASFKFLDSERGKIKIVGLHPHVRVTFDITRLDQIFNIYQSVEEAMRES